MLHLKAVAALMVCLPVIIPAHGQELPSGFQAQQGLNDTQFENLKTILKSDAFDDARNLGIDVLDISKLVKQPDTPSPDFLQQLDVLKNNGSTLVQKKIWTGSVLQKRYGSLLNNHFPDGGFNVDGVPEARNDLAMERIKKLLGDGQMLSISGEDDRIDGLPGDVALDSDHPLAKADLGDVSFGDLLTDGRFHLPGLGSFPSVGLLVENSALEALGDGKLVLKADLYRPLGKKLCAGQKFANHLATTASSCTGFLAKVDHVNDGNTMLVSAAHCFAEGVLKPWNTKVVFGFVAQRTGGILATRTNFEQKHVISLGARIDLSSAGITDIAAFQLSTAIPDGMVPYEVDMRPLPHDESKRFIMVGHPAGLSQAIDINVVENERADDRTMIVSADSFHGNSGSPVFDMAQKKVVGLISGGHNDYKLDETGTCTKYDGTKEPKQSQEKALLLGPVLSATIAAMQ